jgi:hypothetical protein
MGVRMSIARAFCWFNDQKHDIGMAGNVQFGTINDPNGKVVTVVVIVSVIGLYNSRIMQGLVQAFS